MEKFAIKIDENVRLRLYKICRLCGTDNPNNSTILEEEKICCDDEPEFQKKVLDCIGIQVTKIDKMPQNVCHLCRDKINDFFEFRDMCLSNEIQTRRLLGLPAVCAAKIESSVDIKVQLEDDKTSVDKTIKKRKYIHKKDKVEKKPPPDIKKKLKTEIAIPKKVNGRKRKAQPMNLLAEKPPNKRERLRETQIIRKSKHIVPPIKVPTLAVDGAVSNVFCPICDNAFYNAGELHRHLDIDHVPRVVSYHCVRCNESIEDKAAIKNHNLWHKLSKTPFECGRCAKEFVSLVGLTKHLHCCLVFDQRVEYDTKTCKTCKKDFVTRNLYNWHGCVLAKLKCPMCHRRFVRKLSALKHIVRCSSTPINSTATPLSPEAEIPCDEPFENSISDDGLSIDDEINIKPDIEFEIEIPRKEPESEPSHFVVIPPGVTNLALNSTSIADKNTVTFIPGQIGYSNRNLEKDNSDHLNVVQHSEKQQLPSISIKKEPGLNIAEIDSNVNVSNTLNMNEVATNANKTSEPASTEVRIKAEIINHDYVGLYDSSIAGNIKEERMDSGENVVVPKPTLKLVIKKEHGTLNSSFVSGGSSSCDDILSLRKKKKKSKKIFKIPKELAMKIKQEKLDSYETGVNADSDELDEVESTDVTMPIISEICSRVANSDCSSAFSFGNKESNLRVPIIASVSSGSTVLPNPANLTIQADKPSLFPAIRIKSEFSLFNFAENENSVSNEIVASGSIGSVGNIRIKTEPNFEEDEFQCPVLCANQENTDIVEGQSQNIVPLEMNTFSPIVAESTNADLSCRLNVNESGSSLRNEEENEAIDFVISRVESINHKTDLRDGKIPLECGDQTAEKELGTSLNFDTCEALPKSHENQSNAPDHLQENTAGSSRTCDESCQINSAELMETQDISHQNNDNESANLQETNDDTIESQNPDNTRETLELRTIRVLKMNEEVESVNPAQIIESRRSDVSENCLNTTLSLTEACGSKINNYKRRASSFEDESSNGDEIIEPKNPKVQRNTLNETLNLDNEIREHDSQEGTLNEERINVEKVSSMESEVALNCSNKILSSTQICVSKINDNKIKTDDCLAESPTGTNFNDEKLISQDSDTHLVSDESCDQEINNDKFKEPVSEDEFSNETIESKNSEVQSNEALNLSEKFVSKINEDEIESGDSEDESESLNVTQIESLSLIKSNNSKITEDKIRAQDSDVKSLNKANFNDENHESHPDVRSSDPITICESKIGDVEITAQDSEVDKKIASQNVATLNCMNKMLNLSKDSIPKRRDDKISAVKSDRTEKFVTSVPEEMSAPDSDIENDLEEYENDEEELESDIEDLELTKDISSLRDLDQERHKNESIVERANKQLINDDTLNPRDEESLLERKQTIVTKNQNLLAHSNENINELNCDKEENLDLNSEINSIPSAKIETLPTDEELMFKDKIDATNATHNFDTENKFEQKSNSDESLDEATISSLPCPSELIHENFNQPERKIPDNKNPNPIIEPNTLSQIPEQSPSKNSDAILNENNPMPSTSRSIMFNINEIAENHNNANIEKQLQNDFDDVSSNSNLDIDETTVASLSEISENSISMEASDKLSN